MRHLKAIVTAVVVTGALGLGVATAYAASSTNEPTVESPEPAMAGPFGPAALPAFDGPPEPGQLLYGESARKTDDGAIQFHDWQAGEVTAASDSSVTVRSADGTTWTWTLTKDTRIRTTDGKNGTASDIKVGDKIMISGLRDGDTRTARAVADPPPDFSKIRKRLPDIRKHLCELTHRC